MNNAIQAIRGMNDILPDSSPIWQKVEAILRNTLISYGYEEIRMPIVEKAELFKRTIGEATDIVEKEMYTFADRNEELLSLRPEGTASCVRAGIEHGLLHNQIQRLWYLGPFFRHERPQKGRYRQFHQCGVEFFGVPSPDADAELIQLSAKLFKLLGLSDHISLQINSLGSSAARKTYRDKLVAYYKMHEADLDEDSKRRLVQNPMRILDSKNPAMQSINSAAPKLTDCLDNESAAHFLKLQNYLIALGIPFTVNPCLVRGLDYYTKTVFEWVTTDLGAQGTICAGGRYDDLVAQLHGQATPALGFAIGLERLILLAEQKQDTKKINKPDVYFITQGESTFEKALVIADNLREAGFKVIVNCGETSFKNQFKRANKSDARFALILGPDELTSQSVSLKFLREDIAQQSISWLNLINFLQEFAQTN